MIFEFGICGWYFIFVLMDLGSWEGLEFLEVVNIEFSFEVLG